jgi:threonine synthase
LRCQPRDGGEALVDLRCPDCDAWVQDTLTVAELRELDARQAALRQELVSTYERTVAEAMEALAFCLGMALELDLLGADDFARPAA